MDGGRDSGATPADAQPDAPPATTHPVDRVGLFSPSNNYAELDGESGPLTFHFGTHNARLFWENFPIAGDWDGDGLDTLGIFDRASQEFRIASQNDSDEYGDNVLVEMVITDVPAADLSTFPGRYAVAGDWNGDGTDGVGVFDHDTNTFYLRDALSTGPAEYTLTLSSGFPAAGTGSPLAGDWDGDGADSVGIYDDSAAFLRNSLDGGGVDITVLSAGGALVAGDFDGDGTDSVATFDSSENRFWTDNTHEPGSGTAVATQFGYAHEHTWRWQSIAGVWQAPGSPVASQGYPWNEQPPSEQGIDQAAMVEALANAASYAEVHSVLVARNNALVVEEYYLGHGQHVAHLLMSTTKSVLSTLLGIAMDPGACEVGGLDTPVHSYLPSHSAYFDDYRRGITIRNMMDMRGGLAWPEPQATIDLGFRNDTIAYTLLKPVTNAGEPPGARWLYNNGLLQLGAGIIAQTCGTTALEYANQHLFHRLGISAPRWDYSVENGGGRIGDISRNNVGAGGLYLRPRDMARFGQLFLSGGNLSGQQIVSEAWVDLVLGSKQAIEGTGITYGLWWWGAAGAFGFSNYPHDDALFAAGAGGQMIFLFPSWDMVIVTTADTDATNNPRHINADNNAAIEAMILFVNDEILPTVSP